jgi:hypothetical protein
MTDTPLSQEEARRALADEIECLVAQMGRSIGDTHLAYSAALGAFVYRRADLFLAVLRAPPPEQMPETPTPEMIRAAWGAWRVRHPDTRLGPGPGFVEAIAAALAARP